MEEKNNPKKCTRTFSKVSLLLLIALLGVSNAMAEYSYDGWWSFSLNSDGTATINAITEEHWGTNTQGKIVFEGFHHRTTETSINIPSSVTAVKIERDASGNDIRMAGATYTVTAISSLTNSQNTLQSVSFPGTLKTINQNTFSNCVNLNGVVFPSSLTTIGNAAFSGCTSLTEITIPASITSMGGYVFNGCTALNKATIMNNDIHSQQFYNCTSLNDIVISDNVTTIGSNAFYNCTGLRRVTIPASVTNLTAGAFTNCSGLQDVTMKVKKIPNSMFTGLSIASVNLEGVEEIGNYAFKDCTALITVTMQGSLSTIGSWAFDGCTSLAEITIPASVKSIGNMAFTGCTALKKAAILNDEVFYQQFYNCTGLEDLTISDNVKTISGNAFNNCSSLKKVTIPASVTSMTAGAFSNCSSLQELTVKTKKIPDNMFARLPIVLLNMEGVEEIGSQAFNYCDKLENILMPSSLTTINNGTFSYCTGLKEVTVNWQTPLPLYNSSTQTGVHTNAFYSVPLRDVTLRVPQGTEVAYKEASIWKDFYYEVYVLVTGISLDKQNIELKVNATAQLTASVVPENADDITVTWQSSATSVATVSADGIVTAVTPGTATITAKTNDGGFTAACAVTVISNITYVTGISLDKQNLDMKVDSTAQLTAIVIPDNADNKTVTWQSSSTSIATVSSTGLVRAVSPGSATITAKTVDGDFAATCTVTVSRNPLPPTIAASTLTAPSDSKEGNPTSLTLTLKAGEDNIPVEAGDIVTITAANLDFVNANLPDGYTATTKENGKLVFSFNTATELTYNGTSIVISGIIPETTNSGGITVTLNRDGQASLIKTFNALIFASTQMDGFELVLTASSNTWIAPVSGILANPITVTATTKDKRTNETATNITGTLRLSLENNNFVLLNGYFSINLTITNGTGTATITKINAYARFNEALSYSLRAEGTLRNTSENSMSGILIADTPVTLTAQARYLTGRISIDTDGDNSINNDAPYDNAVVVLTIPAREGVIDGRKVYYPEIILSEKTDEQGIYKIALPTPQEGVTGDNILDRNAGASLTVAGNEKLFISEKTVDVYYAKSGTTDAPVINLSVEKYARIEVFAYNHPAAQETVNDYSSARSDEIRIKNDELYSLSIAGSRLGRGSWTWGKRVSDNVYHISHNWLKTQTNNGTKPLVVRADVNPAGQVVMNRQQPVINVNYNENTNSYPIYIDFKRNGYAEIVNDQPNEIAVAARIFYRPAGRTVDWTPAGFYYIYPGQSSTYGNFSSDYEVLAIVVPKELSSFIGARYATDYYDNDANTYTVPGLDSNDFIVRTKTVGFGTKLLIQDISFPADVSKKYANIADNMSARLLSINGGTASVILSFSSEAGTLNLGSLYVNGDKGLTIVNDGVSNYWLLPDQLRYNISQKSLGYKYGPFALFDNYGGIRDDNGTETGNPICMSLEEGETLHTIITFSVDDPEDIETEYTIEFGFHADTRVHWNTEGASAREAYLSKTGVSFKMAPDLTLTGQSYTETNSITVYGKAIPSTNITLNVDGEAIKTVKANRVGDYSATVELFGGKSLSEIEEGQYSVITAVSGSRETEPLLVSFTPHVPKVAGLGDLTHQAMLISNPTNDAPLNNNRLSQSGADIWNRITNGLGLSGYPFKRGDDARGAAYNDWQWTEVNTAILRYWPGEKLEYRVLFDKNDDAILEVFVNIENAIGGNELVIPAVYDENLGLWIATGELPATDFAVGTISVDYDLKVTGNFDLRTPEDIESSNGVLGLNIEMADKKYREAFARRYVPAPPVRPEINANEVMKILCEINPDFANVKTEYKGNDIYEITMPLGNGQMETIENYLHILDPENIPEDQTTIDRLFASKNAYDLANNGKFAVERIVVYEQNGVEKQMPYLDFLQWLSDNSENGILEEGRIELGLEPDYTLRTLQVTRFSDDVNVTTRSNSTNPVFAFLNQLRRPIKWLDDRAAEREKETGIKQVDTRFVLYLIDNLLSTPEQTHDIIHNSLDIYNNVREMESIVKTIGNLMNSDCMEALKARDDAHAKRAYGEFSSILRAVNNYTRDAKEKENNDRWVSGAQVVVNTLSFQIPTKISVSELDVLGYYLGTQDLSWDVYNKEIKEKDMASIRENLEKSREWERKYLNYWILKCAKKYRQNVNPIIMKAIYDPSGFAYENEDINMRVTGVKAEVWQADDAEGTNARIWSEADEYGEINPQITGVDGWYAWDVPIGWWQVRLSKEGYDEARSSWLRVIPPQLGVNLEMKRNATANWMLQIDNETVVFPNPTDGIFRIHNVDFYNGDLVSIASLTGQKLVEFKYPFDSIDITHLPKGIYLVVIKTQQGIETYKVTKR